MRIRCDGTMRMLRGLSGTVLCVLLLGGLAGCQGGPGRFVEAPLSYDQQREAVSAVVPMGTSREEAARRLEKAGIQHVAGSGNNIFYCDIWNRPNGERWHLNVALLFDASGKLYAMRPAESETGIEEQTVTDFAEAEGKSAAGSRAATGLPPLSVEDPEKPASAGRSKR